MTCNHHWERWRSGASNRYRCQSCGVIGYKRELCHRPEWATKRKVRGVITYRCRLRGCRMPATRRQWGGTREDFYCSEHGLG